MDIDRFIAVNEPTWRRLEELSRRASTRLRSMDAAEVKELLDLYQRVSSQLSHVRGQYGDPALTARLTSAVAQANSAIYGRKGSPGREIARFFSLTFPGAVWHARWSMLVSAAVFFVPAVVVCLWLLNSPVALEASASSAERQTYVEDLFEQYYYASSPMQFFAEVTVNNIWVSFLTFAGAATAGLLTAVVLVQNGWLLGQAAAWMIEAGEAERFWGFILPHGMLELTAIVIAGGAAFRLGWTLIAPGDRSRPAALRDEGQRAGAIVLGLIAMFVAAGLVEGFITGRGLPVGARVGIGAVGWVLALAYFVARGTAAARAGITGDLTPRVLGTTRDLGTVTPQGGGSSTQFAGD